MMPVARRDLDAAAHARSASQDRARRQQHAADHDHRNDEGEPADGDEHADLGARQPLGGVGAVADHRARQHRAADIVRQRIGGERAQRDEQQRDLCARYGQRDVVVAGERGVGDDRAERRKQQAVGRDRRQRRPRRRRARCRAIRGRAATARTRRLRIRRPARNIVSTSSCAGCSSPPLFQNRFPSSDSRICPAGKPFSAPVPGRIRFAGKGKSPTHLVKAAVAANLDGNKEDHSACSVRQGSRGA